MLRALCQYRLNLWVSTDNQNGGKNPMCEWCFYGSCGSMHQYLHFHYSINLRPKKGFVLPVSVSVHRRTKPHSEEIIFEFRIHYCNTSTSRAWKGSSRPSCSKNCIPKKLFILPNYRGQTEHIPIFFLQINEAFAIDFHEHRFNIKKSTTATESCLKYCSIFLFWQEWRLNHFMFSYIIFFYLIENQEKNEKQC